MEASGIFILILSLAFAGVIAWAEYYSRRHHKRPESSEAPKADAPAEEPQESRERRERSQSEF